MDGKYRHIMLIDGNDDRGIDVAIMTRQGFSIETIRSNVDAIDERGEIFSRDCAQYEIRTLSGAIIHVLVNHFKSQSGGGGPKRKRQAKKVREIVNGLVQQETHVVVLGDLNEGPPTGRNQALNLAELYNDNSPIADCYSLNGFDVGGRPGTYRFLRPAQPSGLHLPLDEPAAEVRPGRSVPQGTVGLTENSS